MQIDDVLAPPILAQLPNLKQSFKKAMQIPVENRLEWAAQQLQEVYRDGWFVNTPVGVCGDGESVYAHVVHLKALSKQYFAKSLQKKFSDYAFIHDIQESVAHAVIDGIKRDLNPLFNQRNYILTLDDKAQVENAAFELIAEGENEMRDIWYDYNAKHSDEAQQFNALDKLCVMWRCVDFVKSGKYRYDDFNDYWAYWSAERARNSLHANVADIYEQTLIPVIDSLSQG